MLSQEQLLSFLSDPESDRIERTVSVNDTEKFSQAVCAFANDMPAHRQPGYLIVGANDDGKPSGLTVTDELLRNLAGLRTDGNILPMPVLSVNKYTLQGGEVAVVEVQPSDLPPVRYKGEIWIRVGPRRANASEQEERILTERRIADATSFDAMPLAGATVDDLSLPIFSAYRQTVVAADIIAANHRKIEDQLASLRFFNGKTGTPTVAGMLLFGKNPRFFLPGAYVQYLKLPGDKLTDIPDDQSEISGDLLTVLKELDLRIKANITTTMKRSTPLRERLIFDYPEVAVRELLMNAVLHRDYRSNTPVRFYWFEKFIEIQSPGGLYGEVTRETLTLRNSYRNPVVAEAMKTLGYVNRFGYGIQRAEATLKENGKPPLEFEIDDRVFSVRIRKVTT